MNTFKPNKTWQSQYEFRRLMLKGISPSVLNFSYRRWRSAMTYTPLMRFIVV